MEIIVLFFVFGVYSFLSLSSFHFNQRWILLKNFLIHCFYGFLIIFRNICIVPLLGFYFIIETNQKKSGTFRKSKTILFKNLLNTFSKYSFNHQSPFLWKFSCWKIAKGGVPHLFFYVFLLVFFLFFKSSWKFCCHLFFKIKTIKFIKILKVFWLVKSFQIPSLIG